MHSWFYTKHSYQNSLEALNCRLLRSAIVETCTRSSVFWGSCCYVLLCMLKTDIFSVSDFARKCVKFQNTFISFNEICDGKCVNLWYNSVRILSIIIIRYTVPSFVKSMIWFRKYKPKLLKVHSWRNLSVKCKNPP